MSPPPLRLPAYPSPAQVVERELLLQEKEKLYKEMKDILARQVFRCLLVHQYMQTYPYVH